MIPRKEEIEDRKKKLQEQHDELSTKINQGRDAIKNMETNLIGLQGAIQQCNWTLELFKREKNK